MGIGAGRNEKCSCGSGRKIKHCCKGEHINSDCNTIPEYMRPPRYFYKYRAINEYTISNLLNETLYFASYEQLNDPSEFNFNRECNEGNLQKLRLFAERLKILFYRYYDYEDYKKFLEDAFKNNKKTTIFCCSENIDIKESDKDKNILMWSHYAGSHKGICIEYERHNCYAKLENYDAYGNEKQRERQCVVWKVKYDNNLPYLIDEKGYLNSESIIKFKFPQWQYENEWRFLNLNSQKKNIPLTECFSRISSIIFGVNTSEQDKKDIIKIFEHKPEKPDFKQAVWDDKESFLRIVEYVPNV